MVNIKCTVFKFIDINSYNGQTYLGPFMSKVNPTGIHAMSAMK